jgi:solute carrier family 35 protein F5
MLLISPLVVTVGLSLTIPLSLVGQMIINSQSSNATYWIGAAIVLVSFLFINYESTDDKSIDESVRDLDRPTLDDFQEPGAG